MPFHFFSAYYPRKLQTKHAINSNLSSTKSNRISFEVFEFEPVNISKGKVPQWQSHVTVWQSARLLKGARPEIHRENRNKHQYEVFLFFTEHIILPLFFALFLRKPIYL